jgi:hypothetical protein
MSSLILFPYTWLGKLLLSNQLVMNSEWLLWSHGKLPKNGNFPEPNFFAFYMLILEVAYMYCG